ncbi:MAG: RecB-family nuclease [Desulfurococcales archaeon]|nr:RecB-family nuclease [Desulfurococcales archaeon]
MLVLNNTSSPSRVMDFIKIGSSMGVKEFAYTKVYGAAAQTGIPDAFKYAYKNGLSLVVMPTLEDFVETVKPGLTILLTGTGQELSDLLEKYQASSSSIALVFDGSDAGFDPLERKFGAQAYLREVPGRLPVVAEVALSLYIVGKGGGKQVEN